MGAHSRPWSFAIKLLSVFLAVLLAACTRAPAPVSAPPPPVPSTPAVDAAGVRSSERALLIDKVWRVQSSSAVAPGTLYSFLADGTLVISAPQQTTSYGRWTYANGALVMIEEGIAYPTDIRAIDAVNLSIRSHNPGTPVDSVLVEAKDIPLPRAPAN